MTATWLTFGEMLRVNAVKYPSNVALSDETRSFTFPQTDRRTRKLANALLGLGLRPGDRVAMFLENSIEICEVYWACAKAGLIVVPINFRCVGPEIEYIMDHAEAKVLVAHDEFVPLIDQVRAGFRHAGAERAFVVGGKREGWRGYEELVESGEDAEPPVRVRPEDPWIQLYTSGTTGKPKGVVRSHESYVAFYLINGIDFRFHPGEVCLTVMPYCHVNATFFSFAVAYVGGRNHAFPARFFDPEKLLAAFARHRVTFCSLVPTHYNLIVNLPEAARKKHDTSCVQKLLCSSAPARQETKKAILQVFPGVQLYEGYGSTEAGIVTTLYPHEQLTRLGSIGRESSGTDLVRILDEERRPVARGEVGELFSRGPMMFTEYFKDEERTKASFAGEYFSAGDMARQDGDGYYFLVDRKNNLIITGGEKVFPSEVEELISKVPGVFDVAVIGTPHDKWGEMVVAVVVRKKDATVSEAEIAAHCRKNVAGYKVPKQVVFIPDAEMPRTPTGKILHRKLRERFGCMRLGCEP
ncbi:MAG: AMP-binding protein [Deltaproteobacteria bacterium]|nr:AMP-binding protein [Deltaproteobacteria bacterium]